MIFNSVVAGGGGSGEVYSMDVVFNDPDFTVIDWDDAYFSWFANDAESSANGPERFICPYLEEIQADRVFYSTFYMDANLWAFDLSSLRVINGEDACAYMFQNSGLGDAFLPALETIDGTNACMNMFAGCLLGEADLSSLVSINATIGTGGANEMFSGCDLVQINLSSLQTIGVEGASFMLQANQITELRLPALEAINSFGCAGMCKDCQSLEAVYFDSLDPTQCGIDPFGDGNAGSEYIFDGCTALAEIHFPASAQTDIEQWTGFADKWGATDATIYFDL